MRALRSPETLLAMLLLIVALSGAYSLARAEGIEVARAEIRIINGLYELDARLHYNLSEESIEALSHGVPLTFKVLLTITEERAYLWDRDLFSSRQDYRLEYHALTEQYLVTNRVSGERKIFHTMSGAVDYLGRIRMALGDPDTLGDIDNAYAELSAELDIESLPAPLRPVAYFSPDWHINSPLERVPLPR